MDSLGIEIKMHDGPESRSEVLNPSVWKSTPEQHHGQRVRRYVMYVISISSKITSGLCFIMNGLHRCSGHDVEVAREGLQCCCVIEIKQGRS